MRTLKIEPDQQPGRLFLSGYVNEYFDLTPLLENDSPRLILNLSQVVDINSMGIKKWIDGIKMLQSKGKTLEYEECPEVIVECCNTTPDFTEGVTIHSFKVTFMCQNCKQYDTRMLQFSELDLEHIPPEFPCPQCGKTMIPEEDDAFDFVEDM